MVSIYCMWVFYISQAATQAQGMTIMADAVCWNYISHEMKDWSPLHNLFPFFQELHGLNTSVPPVPAVHGHHLQQHIYLL